MRYLFLFLIGFSTVSSAQNAMISSLKESPVNGGLEMKDYWVWESSVIKGDDGNYHMYGSRWPKILPFHPGWMLGSEIVKATSKTPEDPYKFKEVVLGERGSQFWDGKHVIILK
ncbi:hypothetical protein [Polaribacter vadi]|uniref:hypothetical protein n=1 Tax=Polaribacter vadi TaxID=1774273 RepID=UPI0030EF4D48|tara:strand:+ start:17956 stop:18297 length:342 start_codon:yes stop_codon:yes gene_type:complete